MSIFAGNGLSGYSGDNGPAVNAKLNSPQGLALDSAGNVYIADTFNYVIRKVTVSTGIITTVAGIGCTVGLCPPVNDGGPALNAFIDEPIGIAVDSTGNLYISDNQGNL